MQIINQLSANQLQTTERPLELKKGELYKAQIKERLPNNEAIIQIRGKEVKATFEGQLPQEDRVTVQVTGQKDQSALVKTITTEAAKTSPAQTQSNDAKVMQSIGVTAKDIPELKQSVQILLDKGMPVTKESVQELRTFFEKAEGSASAKLDTVKALVNKRLEVTQSHLRPIHEALHGKPINEVLTNLAKEIDSEFDLVKNEQKEAASRPAQNNVEKQATDNTSKAIQTEANTDPKRMTTQTQPQNTQSMKTNKELTELLQKNREFVEKAPDLKQAIEKVRAEIVKNPNVDRELAQRLEKVVIEAEKLQSIGKDRLVEALKNAERQLAQREQQAVKSTVQPNKTSEAAPMREATSQELVKAIKEEVAKTANVQRSIETVRNQIVDNPRIPAEVSEKVRQALAEASRLQQEGRITAGKETLVAALNTAEQELENFNKAQQTVSQGEATKYQKIDQVARNATEQPASETVKQVKDEIQREPNLQRAVEKVRDQLVNNPKIDREVAQKLEKAVNEARQFQQIGREGMGRERLTQALTQAENEIKQIESKQQPTRVEQQPSQATRMTNEQPASETVKQVKEEVQREPNLQRAVEKVRDQLVNNPKLDREVAQKLEKAVNEVRQLHQIGREGMGRKRLTQALTQAENELKQMEAKKQPPRVEQQPQPTRSTAEQPARVEQQPSQPTRAINEQSASETVKQVKEEIQRETNLQRAVEKVRDQLVNNPKIDREVAQKLEKAVNEARQLQQIGREGMGRERLTQALTQAENELKQIESKQQPTRVEQQPQPVRATAEQPASETVKQVKEEVQREPNLQRAVEKVRNQLVNNPKIDREVAQKLEKAVNEARQLQQIGREGMGRERLTQALTQAEDELKQVESKQQSTPTRVEQQPSQPTRATTEQPASETVKQVKDEVQREPNLQRAVEKVRDQLVNNPKIDREVAQKLEKAVNEARQLQQIGREGMGRERLTQALAQAENELKQVESKQQSTPTRVEQQPSQPTRATTEQPASETVKQVKDEVQREPNLQRAVEKVRDQLVNNPKIDREVAQKLEKAVNEARQLQQIGREGMGRERLTQALTQAENEFKQIESRQQQSRVEQQSPRVDQPQPVRATAEQPASVTVKQVKEEVQREPNLQRAVEKVRDQLVNNPKIDREVAQKLEKAVNEARQLQQIGREGMGRERLTQALTLAENELKQIESRQQQPLPQTERTQPDVQPKEQKSNGDQQTQPAQRSNEQLASETVKQTKEQVQKEPNLQKAIEQVRNLIANNRNFEPDVLRNLERIANQAEQLEQAGRERITKVIEQIEKVMNQIEGQSKTAPSQIQNEQQTKPTQSEPIQNNQQPKPSQSQQIQPEQPQPKPNQNQQLANAQPNNQNQNQQLANAQPNNQNQQAPSVQPNSQNETQVQTDDPKTDTTQTQNRNEQTNRAQTQTEQPTIRQTQRNEAEQPQPNTIRNNLEQSETSQANEKRPSEIIRQALAQIQKEPNLERALNLIRQELTSNPALNLNTIEQAEKAIEGATQLLDKGRELRARQQITNTLTELEQQLAKTEPNPSLEQQRAQSQAQTQAQEALLKQLEQNEQFQTLPLESKNILVTRVTQKLAQATYDFRELKKEITRNLDNIERLVNTFKKNAYPQVKQMLEQTISKLDNAILKSDMMLFTDMRTEKQLMQASTQLADAKKLLAKGNHAEAAKIVHDIKTLLDKINFKPSDQKVMHYVSKESTNLEPKSPQQQLLQTFDETARSYVRQEPSARQMYEMVRSLGLNHDSDVAKALVFQKGGDSSSPFNQGQGQGQNQAQDQQTQQQQQNLKSALLKLAQTGGDEASAKIAQQAEQALNNLTGQQLLSKTDSGNSLQNMFFNLPVLLGEQPENLQVFVNSKNEGQQVDWENCNLYFLIETKKLGDVGIMLSSTERNLSITIKNDKPGFKQKMEPIASITKEKLQEIGYNVNSINFARMTTPSSQAAHQQQNNTETQTEQTQMRPVFTEKGMDFKI